MTAFGKSPVSAGLTRPLVVILTGGTIRRRDTGPVHPFQIFIITDAHRILPPGRCGPCPAGNAGAVIIILTGCAIHLLCDTGPVLPHLVAIRTGTGSRLSTGGCGPCAAGFACPIIVVLSGGTAARFVDALSVGPFLIFIRTETTGGLTAERKSPVPAGFTCAIIIVLCVGANRIYAPDAPPSPGFAAVGTTAGVRIACIGHRPRSAGKTSCRTDAGIGRIIIISRTGGYIGHTLPVDPYFRVINTGARSNVIVCFITAQIAEIGISLACAVLPFLIVLRANATGGVAP